MKVGEVSEIIVYPRFAYDQIGQKNESNPEMSIPPDAIVSL